LRASLLALSRTANCALAANAGRPHGAVANCEAQARAAAGIPQV